MLKKINRVLRLLGLNLVRAKRKKTKWQKVPPYTREELENCPPNPDWKTQNEGRTHYVGDDCLGAHRGLDIVPGDDGAYAEEMARLKQPTSDNNITGPTS